MRKRIVLLAIVLGLAFGAGMPAAGDAAKQATCDGYEPGCTLTVSVTGSGTVTGDGIKCSEEGGACSKTFFPGPVPPFLTSLTASPDQGWTLDHWGGACSGSSSTCNLDVGPQDPTTVTATFVRLQVPRQLSVSKNGSGTGSVTSTPSGINCGGACSSSFPDGTSVTLNAAADSGSTFDGWGGACSGKGTCIVSMDSDKSVTATFSLAPAAQKKLSVSKAGSGGGGVTSSSGGINCGSTCSASYPTGTSVSLFASPDAGATFDGWGGACSGKSTCTVVMDGDKSVTATFTLAQAPQGTLSVSKTGSGSGAVTSSPSGINCGSTCAASFPIGTNVTLTAAPDAASTFGSWGGACSGTGACTVKIGGNVAVTATFALKSSPPTTTPQITDPSIPEPRNEVPVTTANPADRTLVAELSAGVTGNGVIEGSTRALLTRQASGLSCGFNRFSCYTRLKPQQKIVLRARPLAGYVFKAWTGACAGQGVLCTVVAGALKTVTAIFAPKVVAPSVGFEVRPTGVRVAWRQSVGAGRIVVSGAVGGPANIRVQVRRPSGGPLLTKRLSVGGGRFRSSLPFRNNVLPRGARVLPGGFVAAVTGLTGKSRLPFQLRPIVVPAPLEGVVRREFTSAIEDGPATLRLPRGSTQAWAHFRFATQPGTRLLVTVTWYWPNGKKLGTVKKSNRPEIVSFLKLGSGLPSGLWVAELRAGSKIVKRLSVRVG